MDDERELNALLRQAAGHDLPEPTEELPDPPKGRGAVNAAAASGPVQSVPDRDLNSLFRSAAQAARTGRY